MPATEDWRKLFTIVRGLLRELKWFVLHRYEVMKLLAFVAIFVVLLAVAVSVVPRMNPYAGIAGLLLFALILLSTRRKFAIEDVIVQGIRSSRALRKQSA